MFETKKLIVIIAFLVINLFQFSKIMDEESGLPAYNELKVKIESVRAKIADMDVRNRQLSSEIRVLKKDEKYVQRLIKRELFYVADNELMYIMK